eukprot:165639-Prorocentrum_lima.AAC.1
MQPYRLLYHDCGWDGYTEWETVRVSRPGAGEGLECLFEGVHVAQIHELITEIGRQGIRATAQVTTAVHRTVGSVQRMYMVRFPHDKRGQSNGLAKATPSVSGDTR